MATRFQVSSAGTAMPATAGWRWLNGRCRPAGACVPARPATARRAAAWRVGGRRRAALPASAVPGRQPRHLNDSAPRVGSARRLPTAAHAVRWAGQERPPGWRPTAALPRRGDGPACRPLETHRGAHTRSPPAARASAAGTCTAPASPASCPLAGDRTAPFPGSSTLSSMPTSCKAWCPRSGAPRAPGPASRSCARRAGVRADACTSLPAQARPPACLPACLPLG